MRITETFAESNGKLSAVRLPMLVWSIGVFLVWAWISIGTGDLKAIPEEVILILGIFITGKVSQKIVETKKENA